MTSASPPARVPDGSRAGLRSRAPRCDACVGRGRIALVVAGLAALSGCAGLPFFGEDDSAPAAEALPKITPTVTGVPTGEAASVAAHLAVAGKPCTISRSYFDAITSEAASQAAEAMRAFGHYRAEAEVQTDYEAGDCPAVRVEVEPGRRVRYERIEVVIEGGAREHPAFQKAVANLPLVSGEPLHHGQYKSAKSTFDSLASEFGFLDAEFTTARLEVDPEAGTADVRWVFDSGQRYGLGELSITQTPDKLDEDLIRRIVEYDPEELYSVEAVSSVNRALTRSSYFSSVDVRPRFGQTDAGEIPVDVTLTPRNRHSFTSGVGASTDEGLRGRARYQNRRLNRRGHRASAGLRASLIEQSFSAEYQIPREHPQDEWLTLQAGVRRESVETFDATEFQVSASDTKRRRWDWLETRYIEVDRSTFELAGESRNATYLVPGLRWVKSAANDPLVPRRGYRISLETRGAAERLVSKTSFLRTAVIASGVLPMPFEARLLGRTRLGAVWVDDFAALPPDERFFTGGDQTVRGYRFNTLGPRDAEGRVIGGTYLGVASLEYEQPVYARFAMAAFVDVGNAFGGPGENPGLARSVGIGLRMRSLVGSIRLDFAHPLDNDDLVMFHLRLGPDL